MSEITKFEIDMLDVKAADAFLIHAFINSGGREVEYVVLVDAGNEGDGKKILNHINTYYTQKYIDLAICTHCDSDHYGGFKELIEEHKKTTSEFEIRKFWVHDPYQHVDVDDVKHVRKNQTLKDRLNAAYSFNDGSNLLEKIDDAGISREEPFDGLEYSPLNIFVLGPDEDYYESLIPDFRVDLDFKDEQTDDVYEGVNRLFYNSEDEFYNQTLEKANDDPSKVNQSSVIFAFVPKNNVFLFTGDAGREALQRVIGIDTKGVLKKVKWMKVPHHGSKHNLNSAIISYFHPSISYISTEKYCKYANICTVNALKKVGDVYSTHKDRSSLWYHDGIPQREGYSTATPL
ncbi:MAG: MBL fold metallo-hydrolase [Bacteroidales bacterium]|nr:MBL fold metallo-hydrolase [Bacteroidales bacterium]